MAKKKKVLVATTVTSDSEESIVSNTEEQMEKRNKRKKSPDMIVVSESEESVDSENTNKKNIKEVDDWKSGDSSGSDRKLAERILQVRLINVGLNQTSKKRKIEVNENMDSVQSDLFEVTANHQTKLNKLMLEKWRMFVNFSQCQEQDDSGESPNVIAGPWNPFQAGFHHVVVYLSLLKDVAKLSSVELGTHQKVLGEYLPSLNLENKKLGDLLDLNDAKVEIPFKLKSFVENHSQPIIPAFVKIQTTEKIWSSFVDFCLEKYFGRINPFLASEKILGEYISHQFMCKDDESDDEQFKENQKKSNLFSSMTSLQPADKFYVDNITNLCKSLGKYIKLTYFGKDIMDLEPIQDLLWAGKHLDGRVPFKRGLSSKLAPGYDYTQFTAKHGSQFWQLNLVKQILQDVSKSALDKKKAAWQLGVTEDMITNALNVDKKDPEFNLTLKMYLEKGFGNEEKFWKEESTNDVLQKVRDRKISVKDAAFVFGVSRATILQKVGKIKSEEELLEDRNSVILEKRKANDEKRVKGLTQLEEQIGMAEANLESLSDYEKMRLENLRERQALLVTLNISEDKKALRELTPSRKNMPVDYGRREKSRRIKRKMKEIIPKASVSLARIPRKSPNWVGRWHPKPQRSNKSIVGGAEEFNIACPVPQVDLVVSEVISSNNDYHKSIRFMNSVSEEFEKVADEKIPDKNLFTKYSKIAGSKVSSSEIRCVDTFGDLVCYGDSSGGVGVSLDERSTTLKIHNEPVTRTLFVGGSHGRGILSASLDGTVRLTDLVKQEVTVNYSWIQSKEKEQIGWIEPWNGTNYLINSNRNSVKMIDLRSSKVDTLFSLSGLDCSDLDYIKKPNGLRGSSFDLLGTNIGVHPVKTNLVSICQKFTIKIFDMRNTSQPVQAINMDLIQPPGAPNLFTTGIAGANWSPKTGKYFLACPIKKQKTKIFTKLEDHYPYIFDGSISNFQEPVQIWPPKNALYETASFSHHFGASWCPWDEGVFFTTAVYKHRNLPGPGIIPSRYTVVAIDAASGGIVSEISEDLDNSKYLVECHKTRNWVVVGNARGPGDLSIYKTAE